MARLPLVEAADLPEDYSALDHVPDMYREEVGIDEDWLNTRNVLRALGNNPELLTFHNNAFLSLWGNTGLEERETELTVLTVARELESAYEWQHHIPRAIAAGIDEAEIVAVYDEDLDGFDEKETALLRYVDRFVNQSVTDDVHDELARFYDNETIVGIQVLAGYYALTALVIDAMDVDIEDPFFGWRLEDYE